MARIRWHGATFSADPIRELPNGNWLMRAREHGPRFTAGTEIEVTKNEILEMAAAELPPDPDESRKALDAAMEEERKTLPPVADLLKAAKDQPHGET